MDRTQPSLQRSLWIVQQMNMRYESVFIRASLVVVQDIAEMFYVRHLLQKLDYPAEALTTYNGGRVLHSLAQGNVRVLITTEPMLQLLGGMLSFVSPMMDNVFSFQPLKLPPCLSSASTFFCNDGEQKAVEA